MAATPGCRTTHYCGDGIVDASQGEACDEGALNGTEVCERNCLPLIN